MRRRLLVRSVAQRLPDGEHVIRAVFLSNRHRWMPLYSGASFVGLLLVATLAGFETWTVRIAIGLAAAALAGAATSRYWVLADTASGLVWLRGSRIRHRAVEFVERLPASTAIARQGGTVIGNEWSIDETSYFVTRSYELDLQAIVNSRPITAG